MNSVTLAEALLKYRPHGGLGSASLIDKLASAPGADPWSLDLSREERAMLGRILAEDDPCPSVAEVERAVAALTAKGLRAHARVITQEIARAEASDDSRAVADLLLLKGGVLRALEGLEA
jgi:hypothetical protein